MLNVISLLKQTTRIIVARIVMTLSGQDVVQSAYVAVVAAARIHVALVSDEPFLNVRGGRHALIVAAKPPVSLGSMPSSRMIREPVVDCT